MEPIIPSVYSRRAFFSIPFLALTLTSAIQKKYKKLYIVLPCLLVSSILHWNRPMKYSFIKTIDIVLAHATIGIITSYNSRFRKRDKYIWNYAMLIMFLSYIYNTIRFNHDIYKTLPNTIERERAYLRCVHTHMLCIHVVAGLSSSWVISHSHS